MIMKKTMFREYDIRGRQGRQEGFQLKRFMLSICVNKITYESGYYCYFQMVFQRLILQQKEEKEMKLETLKTEVYCGLGNTSKRMHLFHWKEKEKKIRYTAKYILLLSILFIFFSTNALLLRQNVKFFEKVEISHETVLPLNVKAFCVTEDELFIIQEHNTNNILFGEYAAKIKIQIRRYKIGGKKKVKTNCFANRWPW